MSVAPRYEWDSEVTSQSYASELPDVAVDLTNRCPLVCRHCYNSSGEGVLKELSIASMVRILDQLSEFGQRSLKLSGGEPTHHPHFARIVREAQDRKIQVCINTSGRYPTCVRQQLARLGLARIVISLDGMQQEHDAIRGRGSFELAKESLRASRDACEDVTIAVHVRRSNARDADDLIDLAHAFRVAIKFSPLRPLGRAVAQLSEEFPAPEDFRTVVQAVTGARKRYPGMWIGTDFDILGFGVGEPRFPAHASCPAGRTRLNVSYDGDVYPCSFFAGHPAFSIGNVDRSPIIEMWRQSPVLAQFRVARKSDACRRCGAYGSRCNGGCVAMSYFTAGRLHAHDPVCFEGREK
jgi:radical SAM protein with 4Fe4S-binding SPASM domain